MSERTITPFGFVGALGIALAAAFSAYAAPAQTDRTTEDYNMAVWLYSTQKYELAAEEYDAFLKKYPQHEKVPDALLGLAQSLLHVGKHEEAVAALERLRRDHPNYERTPEAFFHLGQALAAAQKSKEAAAAFGEIVARHGSHYLVQWARARQGETLVALKDYAGAEKALAPLIETFLTGKDAASHLKAERERLAQVAPNVASGFDALLERAHLNLGLARAGAGRFDEAAKTFENFLALAPNSALGVKARFQLAQALYQAGQYERAAQRYAEVAATPDDLAPDAAFERGLALYKAGKHREAAAAFDDCAKRFPKADRAGKAVTYAGMCLYLAEDYPGAVARFEERLKRDPKDEQALYWLGMVRLKEKKAAEARAAFDKVLEVAPEAPIAADAMLGRADAFLAEGRNDEAAAAYQQFAAKFADHAGLGRALYMAAAAFHRAGKYDASEQVCVQFFQKAGQKTPPEDAWRTMTAQVLFISGENRFLRKRYKESADRYRALLEEHPASPDVPAARFRLAWVRYFDKDYDGALKQLDQVGAANADAAVVRDAAYLRGNCLLDKGDDRAAVKALDQYLAAPGEKPHGDDALLKVATALSRLGDTGGAAARLNQFVRDYRNSPLLPRAEYELGELLRAAKKFDEAAAHYKTVADGHADHEVAPYALYGLAVCLFEKGALADAAGVFGRIAERYPKSDLVPQALYQQALSLQRGEVFGGARAAYQAMLQKYPGHDLAPSALLGLGVCLQKEKKYEEAAEAFRKLFESSKDAKAREQAAYERAWSLQEAGKEQDALAAYEILTREFPDGPLASDAYFQLAEARYRAEKYAEAVALYEKASAATKNSPHADLKDKILYRIGWCKWTEKKYEEAATVFDRLVAEAPESDLIVEALLQAGEAYARTGKPADAIARLERLLDPKYKDFEHAADARFRLGESQLVLGRTDQALATFTALEGAFPDYPAMAEVQFNLGKTLYELKRNDQARARFERVVAMTETETGAKAQFYIGETYLAAGDARLALRAFLRVVSPLWSGYREWAAAAQFEIGKCYLDLKKPKEAREAFRTVLEKHADTKWAEPAKEQLAKLPPPSGT
ncbi:MAG: tetratricopeptide repeat protein [Phycisphaerae bacterium]